MLHRPGIFDLDHSQNLVNQRVDVGQKVTSFIQARSVPNRRLTPIDEILRDESSGLTPKDSAKRRELQEHKKRER